MNLNLIKGDELEKAVLMIESLILKEYKSTSNLTFNILPKYKKVISGVTHEIDIYIEVILEKGFNSIFLFECKNWSSKKVNKNEIVAFSEKIKVFGATKGFFMGTEFTLDARNQAKLDNRIELKSVEKYNLSPIQHVIIEDPFYRELNSIAFYEPHENFESDPNSFSQIDSLDCPEIKFEGTIISLDHFLFKLINILYNQEYIDKNIDEKSDRFKIRIKDKHSFKKGSLTIDNKEFDKVQIDFNLTIEKCIPEMKFGYQIESRGQYIELEIELSSGTYCPMTVTIKED